MRTEAHDKSTISEGNLEDLEIVHDKFGFDEDGIEGLMDILTDAYTDTILAILRELSINARDSHVAAGKAHVPVRVTLPTSLTPELVIEDRGTGLSFEDVSRVFTKYGYSTKRDSDLFTGMLGIGSKAPLAYAETFTVVARKDGIETTLIVGRDENGIGATDKFKTSTSEPNGVTVSVPVAQKDVGHFRSKAEWFFSFWSSPVLVDDAAPKPLPQRFVKVNDEFALSREYYGDSYVVMGDIPYRVTNNDGDYSNFIEFLPQRARPPQLPSQLSHAASTKRYNKRYKPARFCYILWVPMGAVNFAPAREELKKNEKTITLLKEVAAYGEEYLPRILDEWTNSAPLSLVVEAASGDLLQGLPFLRDHKSIPTWENEYKRYSRVLTTVFSLPPDDRPLSRQVAEHGGYAPSLAGPTSFGFTVKNMLKVRVENFTPAGFGKRETYRLLEVLEKDSGLEACDLSSIAWFLNGPEKSEMVEFDYTLDWQDVIARTKIARRAPKARAKKMLEATSVTYKADAPIGVRISNGHAIDKAKPILWHRVSETNLPYSEPLLFMVMPDAQVARIYAKDEASFKAEFPTAERVLPAYRKAIENHLSGLSYRDIFVILGDTSLYDFTRHTRGYGKQAISLEGMNDLRLRRSLEDAIRVAQLRCWRPAELTERECKLLELSYIGGSIGGRRSANAIKEANKKQFAIYEELMEKVTKDYPLLHSARDLATAIEYVNAMRKYRRN